MSSSRNTSTGAPPTQAELEQRQSPVLEGMRYPRDLHHKPRTTGELVHTGEGQLARLARAAAHDMNNVLTVIGGNVDWILRHASPEASEDDQLLQHVLSAVKQGSEIMHSLEAYSRSLSEQDATLPIDELMEHTVRLAQRLVPRSVHLHYDGDPSLADVRPGRAWMLSLLVDWVTDVLQLFDQGRILLQADLPQREASAFTRQAPKGKHWLRVILKFEGETLTPEHQDQLPATLGMSHPRGGSHGAPIRMVLPERDVHAALTADQPPAVELYLPSEAMPQASAGHDESGHGRHIVVLDDEVLITQFIRRYLESYDYRVHVLHRGADFLAYVRDEAHPVDLAVVDLHLPDVGGADCIQALREQRGRVPFIVISGSAAAPAEIRSRAAACLEKPFSTRDLLEAVRCALATASLARQP